jgi:hypothetical protein
MGNNLGSSGISRSLRVLVTPRLRAAVATLSALALIAGFPAVAQAKKEHKLKMDPDVPTTPVPTGPVPPEADANGHVNYGNPQAEGLGRVSVKSKSSDKVQVYLEGRYFGDAPITIYSVPKGDYIVEGTIVSSGKQVSSPVTVTENEEANVELGSGKIETPAVSTSSSGGFFGGEISPRRLLVTKIFIGAAAAGAIGTVAFAILEHNAESDYEAAPPGTTTAAQQNLDSITSRGKNYALLTNVSLLVLGAGVAGAIIAGYPMVVKSNGEKNNNADVTQTPQALLTPVVTPGGAGASFSMRF